jgi:hypothetical protein
MRRNQEAQKSSNDRCAAKHKVCEWEFFKTIYFCIQNDITKLRHRLLRELLLPSEFTFVLFYKFDCGRLPPTIPLPWVARSYRLLGFVMALARDHLPRVIQVYPRWGFDHWRFL